MERLLIISDESSEQRKLSGILGAKYETDFVSDIETTTNHMRTYRYVCIVVSSSISFAAPMSLLEWLDSSFVMKYVPVVYISGESLSDRNYAYKHGATEIVSSKSTDNEIYQTIKRAIKLYSECEWHSNIHYLNKAEEKNGFMPRNNFFELLNTYTSQNVYGSIFCIRITNTKEMLENNSIEDALEILNNFSKLFLECFGEISLMSHLYGNEYAVFVQDLLNHKRMEDKVNKFIVRAKRIMLNNYKSFQIGVAIGAAICPEHSESVDQLYSFAYKASRFVQLHYASGFYIYDRRDVYQGYKPFNKITNTSLSRFLRSRKDEKNQIFVTPGEMRVVWNGYRLLGVKKSAVIAAITIKENNPFVEPPAEKIIAVRDSIIEAIKSTQQSGIFSIISQNEILAMFGNGEDYEKILKDISSSAEKLCEANSFEIVYQTKF